MQEPLISMLLQSYFPRLFGCTDFVDSIHSVSDLRFQIPFGMGEATLPLPVRHSPPSEGSGEVSKFVLLTEAIRLVHSHCHHTIGVAR